MTPSPDPKAISASAAETLNATNAAASVNAAITMCESTAAVTTL